LFEKLKKTLSSISDAFKYKQLSQKQIEEILQGFELELLECDVAQEVVEQILGKLRTELNSSKIEKHVQIKEFVKNKLREILLSLMSEAVKIDIFNMIEQKKKRAEPYVILFLGINGTGKTTTIAKFANLLKSRGYSVVIAAGDTHRAGAIEQITEHASRLGIKVISQKYGADPAAVARDGVIYSRTHHADVLLIDTAGRMQTNQNLMLEMSKIVKVVNPDLKILVVDSLTGNDAVSQAKLFSQYTGFEGVILTKADADSKGGSAISIAYVTKRPILFIGTGQGYEDISEFDYKVFLDSILK
jgi:fused signal recognition particle receptor